jgi:hypothetical protein
VTYRLRPLFYAFRRISGWPCETAFHHKAAQAALDAIDAAMREAAPESPEDLAAQILAVTRDGCRPLPAETVRMMRLMLDVE